jgi:hypothetical protein
MLFFFENFGKIINDSSVSTEGSEVDIVVEDKSEGSDGSGEYKERLAEVFSSCVLFVDDILSDIFVDDIVSSTVSDIFVYL